ncbi:MAG: PAS domain-containing sensor histidine kinase, partial [Variovorax sp.]
MLNETDIQRIFRAMPGLFLVLKPDAAFTIAAASADFLRATHTDESIYGRALFDVFAPAGDGMQNLGASLQHVPTTDGAPVLAEDGTVAYIVHRVDEHSAKPDRNAVGSAEQKTLEAERERLLAESERQQRIYETALNSTPDFVYVFDLEHRALYANDALLKTWGVDEVLGRRWTELGYEQWQADLHDAEIETVIATRAPIRGEIPFTGTNGTRMYEYIFAPVLSAHGEVVAVAGTTRDITERQAAEQSVREQADRLAQADMAKDEFLATLSHELRNPLAPLRTAIELLRRIGTADEKSSRLHAMMDRQITHLVRLVDDLLEMSRISRGTLSLRRERVALATVVGNALETSDPLVKAAGHALVVELPDEPMWLEGDPVRLAQIVANLLNNAAKYTENNGRIVVRAWRESSGNAAISVTDNGIGIEPDMLPRLFEMFSRGNRDSGRNQGGLGIGLALSRRLAQMHNGTLDVASDGPGAGSVFTVRLPAVDAGL